MRERDNSKHRFGSASFASYRDLKEAGMFNQQRNSLLIGFHGKKPIYYSGAGGWLLCAGARSGKLRDILAYSICASGIYSGPSIILDMKGELSFIAQDQTPDGKYAIHWNPLGFHGLQKNRINPIDYIRKENPALVSAVKLFCQNFLPMSKANNAEYFDRRAQEFLEGIVMTEVTLNGVVTLPRLYQIVNSIMAPDSDEWLDFAYEMANCGFPLSKRIEEEIANSREDNTGGFTGILGVLFKGFACLSDDKLLESVSPPYDFSLSQMCSHDQTYQLSLMPPAEFIEGWAPVIKSFFVAMYLYKAHKPDSPQITMFLDECAQLGSFPLLVKAFTYGAGVGLRPVAVFQSTKQMAAVGENAENIITSSAQLRTYFGVRDLETATTLSKMIGTETLNYEDGVQVAKAQHSKQQAVLSMMNGEDPIAAALNYSHYRQEVERPRQIKRQLLEPNEILHMPSDKLIFFTDQLPKPAYVDRKPYYEQRWMAGRYHPNPYHPPIDKVRVKTWWGHAWRKVIRERVPEQYAHYPQYADGFWSRIED